MAWNGPIFFKKRSFADDRHRQRVLHRGEPRHRHRRHVAQPGDRPLKIDRFEVRKS